MAEWRIYVQVNQAIIGSDKGFSPVQQTITGTNADLLRIHGWPLDSPHKGPATQEMFPLDGVIMILFAATVAPTSCADVATQNPNATDGEYWVYHSSGPIRVYCHNMTDNPAAYISLIRKHWFFKVVGHHFYKVAIDLVVSHSGNYL